MQKRIVQPEEWHVGLTPFDEAVSRVTSLAEALKPNYVALDVALGMVTAQNVASSVNVPPFDNSSMDGYAVDASTVHKGDRLSVETVAHISTGMPLPQGANSVVPWEHTHADGSFVTFEQSVEAHQYVREAGHDISSGDIVVPAGTRLGAVHLGALASLGHRDVLVHRRPKIAVLVTGDELSQPGSFTTARSVFDVNSTLLPALLRSAGAEVTVIEQCVDDRGLISKTMSAVGHKADLIVTTGGASVGERDWVRTIVQEEGELLLWRVALRPGKPFAAGRFADKTILLLPGNPGSVLACTHAFVSPLIRKMLGAPTAPERRHVELTADLVNDQERTFLCPVRVVDGKAEPLIGASSQGLHHALDVGGFVVAPPRSEALAGTSVWMEVMA